MSYKLTMLYGQEELRAFGQQYGLTPNADTRVAYIVREFGAIEPENTGAVLFFVDAKEEKPANRKSPFQVNIIAFNMLKEPGHVAHWTTNGDSTFMSNIMILDSVYRRFDRMLAEECVGVNREKAFTLLCGMLAGMQINRIV